MKFGLACLSGVAVVVALAVLCRQERRIAALEAALGGGPPRDRVDCGK